MTEKVFIDSNILIYAYTGDDEHKHLIAWICYVNMLQAVKLF